MSIDAGYVPEVDDTPHQMTLRARIILFETKMQDIRSKANTLDVPKSTLELLDVILEGLHDVIYG